MRGDWYCDTWDRTADGERTFRVDRIREARALDETFERRESLTARVDGALGDQAGTASFWFSAEVARWELDRRPDTNRLADGAALASVPYGNERWLCAEVCRYLGEAVLLEPEALRAQGRGACTGARGARSLARHRQHFVSAPQARWLSDAQVAGLLPPPLEAAELARSVLVGLAEGTIELPPKPAIHPRPDAFVNTMPAYVGSLDGSGVKLVSVFPGNRARGLPAISAIVIVLDSETGLVRGLLGATALTACRTAAASAACAARLAPAAPGHVAITGAGVEARTHLLALEAQGYRGGRRLGSPRSEHRGAARLGGRARAVA